MKQGELPGILFLVSSKKAESDFLEAYTQTQINNPNTYIVSEPIWNIKPASTYSGKKFYIAVGNKYVKSTVVKDGEDLESYEKQGYQVMSVPIEYKEAFNTDIDSALMDIANIPVIAKSKYISLERLRLNYDKYRRNPFTSEVLTIGLDDSLEIEDFFNLAMIDDYNRSLPGFVHVDTSIKGDKTGISYVSISGTKSVAKYKRTDDNVGTINETDLVYRQLFSIGIQAPSNSEISFEKTRKFIYYLRTNGFNIQGVSTDGFQSRDTLQQLLNAGFKASLVSLDRSPDGYQTFKAAVNEVRLDLLNLDNSLLENEIINLEQDSSAKGKIDHPMNGCIRGNTLVLTTDGCKCIKDLQEDDIIYSYDYVLCVAVKSSFKNLRITKYVTELYSITFEDDEIFECTGNHLILNQRGLYIPAEELTGFELLKNIMYVFGYSIKSIELTKVVREPVYDIEVPEFHNFILANGLVVHNSKDISDSLAGAIFNASKSNIRDSYIHRQDDLELLVDLLGDSHNFSAYDTLQLNGRVVDERNYESYDDGMIVW